MISLDISGSRILINREQFFEMVQVNIAQCIG